PVAVTKEMLAAARAAMPELPAARADRLAALGLSGDSARLLAFRPELGDRFEQALAESDPAQPSPAIAQAIANWLSNEDAAAVAEPAALAAIVAMVEAKEVTRDAGRAVLAKVVSDGGNPRAIVAAES